MLFNSFDFAIFLVLCLSFYFALQVAGSRRGQNLMLLLASYLFYAAWDWRFLGLIAISTGVDYYVGLALQASRGHSRRRALVTLSLVTNLGILGLFKYLNFFADGLRALAGSFGLEIPGFALTVILPVGISFYTFQTLSYTLDIYRRRLAPTRDLLDFALFVAFFPQLVAGPIERAARLLPQMSGPRRPSWDQFNSGCWLILWGLFKKVVIADNLATMVEAVYGPASTPTPLELLLATYGFAIQIYCDFSGYTDMARGIARLMGFDLILNFRLPYFAANPAEFWRRWHISLSTWLRDYLYISLGGNRLGSWLTYRNLLLTMLLGGLWHGAAWPFVLWGAYHGLWLILHRLARPTLGKIDPASAIGRTGWHALRVVVTFHGVCLGWLMFRADSLQHIGSLLGTAAQGLDPGLALEWLLPLAALTAPLLLMQIAQARSGDLEIALRWPLPARVAVYAAVFLMIAILGEDGGQPFVYFQF
jgi:D-alanyl-lipoteichoic acid acyltransferase DltB (MBOAT superfamily)